jgi:acyl-coenzyme A thioesterase 13
LRRTPRPGAIGVIVPKVSVEPPRAAPPDFEPLTASPFVELIGPLYINLAGPVPVVGVHVAPNHTNRGGRAHGGLMMTLADVALSRAVSAELPPGASWATADLHIAFLRAVEPGVWLEAVPNVERAGRSLIHASCEVRAGSSSVAKVLATFAVRLVEDLRDGIVNRG